MSRIGIQKTRRVRALHRQMAGPDGPLSLEPPPDMLALEPTPKMEPLSSIRRQVSHEIQWAKGVRSASLMATLSGRRFVNDMIYEPGGKKSSDSKLTPRWGSLRKLAGINNPVIRRGIVGCSWSPPAKGNIDLYVDFVRPPVEAMLLAADWLSAIPDIETPVRVLAVGLGFVICPAVLTQQRPIEEVWHVPVPFLDSSRPSTEGWDATVLSIPDKAQHHVGSMIHCLDNYSDAGALIRKVQTAKRSRVSVPTHRYLQPFVDVALRGCPLVVIAGLESYGDLIRHLTDKKLAAPLLIDGRDTTTHPVWLDYEKRPWMPRYLPRLTGRLMSLWRWA
jgi:hypothetical protein